MNKKRLLNQAIVAAIAFSSSQAVAAGFQLNSQSATGLGRAFAGDAVIADNASAMARNPAAMALFKKSSLSLGFNVIDTDVRIKQGTATQFRYDEEYIHHSGIISPDNRYIAVPTDIGFKSKDISGTDGIGGTSFVPNIYFVQPINDQWAWGLSAYSNFGTSTSFTNDFAGSAFGGTTSVKSFNVGASVSYRLNDSLSFGAGLDVIYGTGELHRNLNGQYCSTLNGNTKCQLLEENILDANASGYALGWNVGTVYEINEDHRFGLSYRKSPTLKAKGDVYKAGTVGLAKNDTLHIPLPDMAEFSGYHRLAESFALHYSLQWVGWGAFDQVKSDAHGTIKEYKWKDAGHASLGGTYYLNNDWTLRAGYMYDKAATVDIKSISIPDSDRQWFSAGVTYQLSKSSTIDFGATYLLGKDTQVEEKLGVDAKEIDPSIADLGFIGTQVKATTRADAVLIGLQYSHTF
ncbi:aromatic hydrocarbon degradation protein [Photobacterium jeanii]|uniref:Aromatic hydrocarbon degradation protein n=1 Tax=Photobacterium jeanii TaxID=858640 RepID=A0A178KAK6_9GAMM|nr:outer membrane protein transport protein [Photobacterium jeanii]OAN13744.1 aromatic hydrocarbon degradation protein [Photobacterium jeanii]PST88865.1 aromatic hydrocarbon degradation protein [Photobacterium jeanii]